ncbi:hypothetical protein AJ81_01800 [Pseudothermotoga hypogea DSM 11164 = NBRC 106472]|uniref:Cell division protein FtsQ n=1 Tax=Pseudothermotoga hypogea DSM 11164 = NBRC 106472 TaxID=1123384 RepID=A0A0X1KTJ0_9THEM|nr:DUF4894 domain-containing protein [Pseudothermotoga hypogea]AJC74637.1 hypothetical protein AJ81_01800 [Pseudothermotoga hypogea DSM 11164 = NBRC 106472]
MYNFKKAVTLVGIFCSLCIFFFTAKFVNVAAKPTSGERVFLVAHKGRLWWVGRSGELLEVARTQDVLSKAYVSGLEIVNARLDESSLHLIEKLKPALDSLYIVEVIPNEKRVMLLKGVSLRFNDWEDLLRNLQALPEAIKRMEPRGEYFLSPQGLFYKLRGGDDEKR